MYYKSVCCSFRCLHPLSLEESLLRGDFDGESRTKVLEKEVIDT